MDVEHVLRAETCGSPVTMAVAASPRKALRRSFQRLEGAGFVIPPAKAVFLLLLAILAQLEPLLTPLNHLSCWPLAWPGFSLSLTLSPPGFMWR